MLYSEFCDKYNCKLHDSGYRLSIKFFKGKEQFLHVTMIANSGSGMTPFGICLIFEDNACLEGAIYSHETNYYVTKRYDILDPNFLSKLFDDIADIG
jgi:hypothetical protein